MKFFNRVLLQIVFVLMFASVSMAAGVVTYKINDHAGPTGKKFQTLVYTWTSTAGGAADLTVSDIHGFIVRVSTNPTDSPDPYLATLTDDDGIDLMSGLMADRDTSISQHVYGSGSKVDGSLTLNITGAGNAKSGVVTVYLDDYGNGSHNSQLIDASGNVINEEYPLYVRSVSELSVGNSTATPLPGVASAPNHIFTGSIVDILHVAVIGISVYSDVASAVDGLSIQFSTDGTNWDNSDDYTIAASTGETYSVQPVARYMQVIYTNGAAAQSEFRLQTILHSTYIKPSSHRTNDTISGEDDAELVKAVLAADSGNGSTIKNINPQHPLPVDGDQVYEKDIDQDRSTSVGWTGGEVIDLVNDNYTTLVNSTATNPKVIYMEFKRPLQTSIFGITTPTGDFSNTKITGYIGLGADQVSFVMIDESADGTKKTVLIPDIQPVAVVAIKIEFHTADTCSLSANIVSKSLQRISRIQALKPDGTITDIDATAGGNLKTSIEEFDDSFESNPLPVRDPILEISRGYDKLY